MNKQTLNILGSTGSIGTQTLQVVEKFPENFEINILSCESNYLLLAEQIKKFKPKIALINKNFVDKLKNLFTDCADYKTKIYSNDDFSNTISEKKIDISLIAVSGFKGISYSWEATKFSKRIALANKESIVCGGEIFLNHVKKFQTEIIPVDSEHNTIFQLLCGIHNKDEIEKIVITASGGPFFEWTKDQLQNITPTQAAKHPKWQMGQKISIDSATLMNKALEIIECFYLFGTQNIEAVIHPQSLIHGALELKNGMIIAGMANNDMRTHITHSLFYPKNFDNISKKLNLKDLQKLEFFDTKSTCFPFILMAHEIITKNAHLSIIFNSLGEIAVDLFIKNKISFLEIGNFVEENFNKYNNTPEPKDLNDLIEIDKKIRNEFFKEMVF
jgi:1-deoxy-D-xylulose-5-phosphate reductoisomerase